MIKQASYDAKNKLMYRSLVILFWLIIFAFFFYVPSFFIQHDMSVQESQTLRIFTFTDVVSRDLVRVFEEETGIKVALNYFQSNEDLFAKLVVSKGAGYDLIVCSDYMCELLIKNDLLRQIDQSKIESFNDIDERLLGKYYDPMNRYTVPFGWTYYGIGLSKKYFFNTNIDPSWDLVFKPHGYVVAMPDDVREAVFLAGCYLFGNDATYSDLQLNDIKNLLITQKGWVESYGGDKADYLLISGVVPAVVAQASFMRRVVQDNADVEFVFPKEGSLMIIENIAVPKGARNIKGAFAFINYMLMPDISAALSQRYGYNPVNTKASALLDDQEQIRRVFAPSDNAVNTMGILSNDVSLQKLENLWLAVKAA